MSLKGYQAKRNFAATPEPTGGKASGQLKFVVQRHQASHLHYDFRLELDGVLLSWAVPKGPSLNPADRRLAMHVEDHPYDYRTFYGIIPQGNYGAGVVEIWDEGTYHALQATGRKESEEILRKQLAAGSLKFVLQGTHLQGEFALVKMHPHETKDDKSWLLIKHNDEYALHTPYNIEAVPVVHAVKTADTKPKARATKPKSPAKKEPSATPEDPPAAHQLLQGTDPMPQAITPMMAKLVEQPFKDDDWLFELKWDGYRAIAAVQSSTQVELYSRNGISFTHRYGPIVQGLSQLPLPAVLDGELLVMNHQEQPIFQALQNYDAKHDPHLFYYAFDLLWLNGRNLMNEPLHLRKALLQELLAGGYPHLRYSEHVLGDGPLLFQQAQARDLEGIMAKKSSSTYLPGVRSANWLKIKIHQRQEVVIGGYTTPRGSRQHFGALLLGVYKAGKLHYIGHTGTGFDSKGLATMMAQLQPLVRPTSPFVEKVPLHMATTWVQPKLVAEVSFAQWTEDNVLRQAVFKGLRPDKDPRQVVQERAMNDIKPHPEKIFSYVTEREHLAPMADHASNSTGKPAPKPKARSRTPKVAPVKVPEITVRAAGHLVRITHPDKVFWPDEGYTKKDLVDYYQSVAKYILPYLKDRPESLHRHPNGINEGGFFQKDVILSLPDWVETVEIHSDSTDKEVHFFVCNNSAALAYLNNLGCIELNPFSSRVDFLEKPDFLIVDLDPSDKNTFDEVIDTALVVKQVLDKAGATAVCKTSGATGLHIYVPLAAQYEYEHARAFAQIVAELVHAQLPQLTSLARSPKDRTEQIYIDYLQNSFGQTIAAPYSVRPRPTATVSTPLQWKELKHGLTPQQFTIKNIPARLEKVGDIFEAVLGPGINLEACLKKLGA